jgi:hypothetical protein
LIAYQYCGMIQFVIAFIAGRTWPTNSNSPFSIQEPKHA